MSDDIVTRLREYEAIADNAYVINALVAAADEIERLREQLRAFKAGTHTPPVNDEDPF